MNWGLGFLVLINSQGVGLGEPSHSRFANHPSKQAYENRQTGASHVEKPRLSWGLSNCLTA